MRAFDHGCTFVDPETGAPCLKVGGHDALPVSWHCPRGHDDDAPGRAEPFECSRCGMIAQSPTQHLTMRTVGGPVLKIVPLEKFKRVPIGPMEAIPHLYTSVMLDGVLTRGVQHAESCASRKVPLGELLIGPYECDCGAS